MKKLLSLLMMALLAMGAWASEITITMNNTALTWTASGDDQTTTFQGITIYYAKAGSKTATSQGLTANHIRFYKDATVKISAGAAITKIVFTPDGSYTAKDCFTPNVGSMSGNQEWTGNATEITFTMAAQYRCKKMVVTVEDGSVSAPYFNPAAGTYYGPTTISIHGQEGATVY